MRWRKRCSPIPPAYDGAISNYLTGLDAENKSLDYPERLTLQFAKVQDMRYGENPHQSAAFYRDLQPAPGSLASYTQLQGKELSFNNIGDADAAWECAKTFVEPACVIVKHANPCGVAIGDTTLEAYQRAFPTDPTSAFGGIIAFNRPVDAPTAEAVAKQFVEVVIAPAYDKDALKALASKANVRVLVVPLAAGANRYDFKRVGGGLLAQTPGYQERAYRRTARGHQKAGQRSGTARPAVRLARGQVRQIQRHRVLRQRPYPGCGRGPDEPRRQRAHRRDQRRKCRPVARGLGGSLGRLSFPFRDGVDVVAEAGAKAIIQPGGSMRDEEVVAAADELGLVMVYTGHRHFRH